MSVERLVQVDVDEATVRALLRDQQPDLADRALRFVARGWDNALWRLGDDLVVRLPVREVAVPLVTHEQRWLPVLAPVLPVAVPVPVRVGVPSERYPWPWSVARWVEGARADAGPVEGRASWADDLADLFVALHRPAPADAPVNPYRGVPPRTRRDPLVERLAHLGWPHASEVLDRFDELAAAPDHEGPPLWLHGDPHPANLVVRDGRLVAAIDWGDVTSGDPASDLATAWLTFDAPTRARFRARVDAACGWDDATWQRAQAWAVLLSVVLQLHPEQHPDLVATGRFAWEQARS
ncbi:aminoglycoside phosphotransferase family protein [Cellulomonas massiliensis]|uniref:aminoglycoside phosphotransferase family protein n=1 Tax=Cellulomonas massiliensis TaxID=1465811 RepID=UPI0002F3D0B3|nr:aminoglycoside phosphotransferase family protein [Cellulomonas massiliensis]